LLEHLLVIKQKTGGGTFSSHWPPLHVVGNKYTFTHKYEFVDAIRVCWSIHKESVYRHATILESELAVPVTIPVSYTNGFFDIRKLELRWRWIQHKVSITKLLW